MTEPNLAAILAENVQLRESLASLTAQHNATSNNNIELRAALANLQAQHALCPVVPKEAQPPKGKG